jgi:hypothetical protein
MISSAIAPPYHETGLLDASDWAKQRGGCAVRARGPRYRLTSDPSIVTFAFQTPSCRAFFQHWRDIAAVGSVPHSNAFLDAAPPDLIPFAYIHDVHPDGLLVRFMGTGLVQRWRHDLTGRLFGGHLDVDAREKLRATMAILAELPCGMRQMGRLGSSVGRALSFEAVSLPLAVDPGRVPRVTIFSQILGDMDENEHSNQFRAAGNREWLDLGWGVPPEPPPV